MKIILNMKNDKQRQKPNGFWGGGVFKSGTIRRMKLVQEADKKLVVTLSKQ